MTNMDKHKSMRRIIQTSDFTPDGRGGGIPPTYRYETLAEILAREAHKNEQKYKEAIINELEQSNES